MPGNLNAAVVSPTSTVFPDSLSTSYTESRAFPMLAARYHDSTIERSLITDGVNAPVPLRSWRLTKRLNTSDLATLQSFFESTVQGGLSPFYFYDPYDVLSGHAVGSNYDATGVSIQGRVTCFFRGNWQHEIGIGRANVQQLEIIEVA